MPDSPPRARALEENWISSATLSQVMQARRDDSPVPPRTPEPKSPTLPSFALSTPSATSSRSIDTSPGSPLRAIQFIRRADRDSPVMMRPDTPSKAPRVAASNTPRQPVWRP
ncbi:hypothetical protein PHLCEN_2v10489 [Hermanssonia centrifuga]|uniref:Uncharacterized protein n=1 Tax=Hermanssonia centrifuga TaxID=98765 RepID=A0A2R6NMJ0_9APHY|nr:hypothetical protein PHLCEN_2v10489 [Hermanssonia centrifuga]